MGSDMNSAVLGAGIMGPAMEDISAARPALGAPAGQRPAYKGRAPMTAQVIPPPRIAPLADSKTARGPAFATTRDGERATRDELRVMADEQAALTPTLPQIHTPVLIIAGARDTAVPPVNAEFLYQRLPHSTLDIIDAGHFTWEDAADEYAALVTSRWTGGYTPLDRWQHVMLA